MSSAVDRLKVLTLESFLPLVNQEFAVSGEEGGEPILQVRLESASAKGKLPENFRQPFSLIFVGPAQPALAQQTVWLSQETLGEIPVFIVPVQRTEDRCEYQAIFS